MKTTLHYYRFDMSKPGENEKYRLLCENLKKQGLRCFDSISLDHNEFYKNKIKPLDNQFIELDTSYLFNNQWNTDGNLRVFDWSEAIYRNRNIKEGMYLDQTEEMHSIRLNTYKCGFCGAMFTHGGFCNKCHGSEYLTENDLMLLRLLPIAGERCRLPLTEAEKSKLMPAYIKEQTKTKTKKAKAQREKIVNECQIESQKLIIKKNGLLWLLDHNINIDNCIYYGHLNVFCFGWQTPISESVKPELIKLLKNFPFDYKIE